MKQSIRKILVISKLLGFWCNLYAQKVEVSVLNEISSKQVNSNYIGNRVPLEAVPFIKLPVSCIKPAGWLKEYLVRQRKGLTGNLGKISAWLNKENNAWLAKDGHGEYGWEEVPYWLKGYGNIGYILEDTSMIEEAQFWLKAVLRSQRSDGNFGPLGINNDPEDFWPKMIMLYCLQSYYEYSGDKEVIRFMSNYFQYQLKYPEEKFIRQFHYWQGLRTGDNLHSVIWLYNITGEIWLLELAKKIHRNSTSWANRNNQYPDGYHGIKQLPDWYGLLPDWHNVNIAQGFREPAIYYQVSGNKADLRASYEVHNIIRNYFGQVPGGMFGGDEISRPGYDDPRQGIETCGIVEEMNSAEHMFRITGDNFWADQAENVAFNTYPAAVMPDFRSLRYLTSPNMVLADANNHSPGIYNSGPFLMMNPFSSRCCQHNHTQGWPYFIENMWMATPDNGLAAVLYGANTVSAKVGDGVNVTIEEKGNYPFEEMLHFEVKPAKSIFFPLYLRIPSWCSQPKLEINGKNYPLDYSQGNYVRIYRKWKANDIIKLDLPMKLSVKRWEKHNQAASVNYGPLSFSLKIDEFLIEKRSDQTAIWDSKWQKNVHVADWPSYEIHPASAWNYGLLLSQNKKYKITVERNAWPADNFPFTTSASPITIKAYGKKIAGWGLDQYGLVSKLPADSVKSEYPIDEIKLIPMGAARLRITSFPVIRNTNDN